MQAEAMTATGTVAQVDEIHPPGDEPHPDVELPIDVEAVLIDGQVREDDPDRQFIGVHAPQERIATDATAPVAVAPTQIRQSIDQTFTNKSRIITTMI